MEPFVLEENDCFDEIKKLYDESFSSKLKIKNHIIKRRLKTKRYQNFLIFKNNQKIGFCLLANLKQNLCHIDYLAIDKNFRGKGTGTEFMKFLILKLRDKIITLECEDSLISFYEKFGFIIIKNDNYYSWGQKVNFMVLKRKYNIHNIHNIILNFNNIKDLKPYINKIFSLIIYISYSLFYLFIPW